jgi:hypothetical protein
VSLKEKKNNSKLTSGLISYQSKSYNPMPSIISLEEN